MNGLSQRKKKVDDDMRILHGFYLIQQSVDATFRIWIIVKTREYH